MTTLDRFFWYPTTSAWKITVHRMWYSLITNAAQSSQAPSSTVSTYLECTITAAATSTTATARCCREWSKSFHERMRAGKSPSAWAALKPGWCPEVDDESLLFLKLKSDDVTVTTSPRLQVLAASPGPSPSASPRRSAIPATSRILFSSPPPAPLPPSTPSPPTRGRTTRSSTSRAAASAPLPAPMRWAVCYWPGLISVNKC